MSEENGTSSSVDYDYTMSDEYLAGQSIIKGVPPFLIIFGTIGNILSIFILTRKNLRQSTCTLYLVVLACSDLVVLYTGLLRQWIQSTLKTDIRTLSVGVCKIHTWIVYVSLDFSAWILVAVTAERVALVWFPHSAKHKCTRKTATCIILSILVFLMAINSHILYGLGEVVVVNGNITTVKKCDYINEAYSVFFDEVWPWMDFSIFCGVPFCCLLLGNFLIITKVISSQRATKRQVTPHDASSNTQRSQVSSMSIMLFCLNCVFLLCTTPVSIYLIGYIYWYRGATEYDKANLSLVWSVVNILMYANNTFNFLLYCMSGSRFRAEVKTVFWRIFGVTSNSQNTKQSNSQRRNEGTDCQQSSPSPKSGGDRTAGSSKANNNFLSVIPNAGGSSRSESGRKSDPDSSTIV